jgi:hypothetical protein
MVFIVLKQHSHVDSGSGVHAHTHDKPWRRSHGGEQTGRHSAHASLGRRRCSHVCHAGAHPAHPRTSRPHVPHSTSAASPAIAPAHALHSGTPSGPKHRSPRVGRRHPQQIRGSRKAAEDIIDAHNSQPSLQYDTAPHALHTPQPQLPKLQCIFMFKR